MTLFDNRLNFSERYVKSIKDLIVKITALEALNINLVLTSGSFDLLHKGHVSYLAAAKSEGDFLLVGLDSDERIQQRKGRLPVIPEDERAFMLASQRSVDMVFLKNNNEGSGDLIKRVLPDVLVVTENTYTPEKLDGLKAYCGTIKVLPRMAPRSTTATIREIKMREGLK